jgi:hypothetical protein
MRTRRARCRTSGGSTLGRRPPRQTSRSCDQCVCCPDMPSCLSWGSPLSCVCLYTTLAQLCLQLQVLAARNRD